MKIGEGYQQLLYGSAGIFGYKILDIANNDFHDVVLIEHSSAVEHEYTVYRFNNKEYIPFKCFTQTARENKNGTLSFSYKEHKCAN